MGRNPARIRQHLLGLNLKSECWTLKIVDRQRPFASVFPRMISDARQPYSGKKIMATRSVYKNRTVLHGIRKYQQSNIHNTTAIPSASSQKILFLITH